jgi:tetratricopeptide (TPR) repeat protein
MEEAAMDDRLYYVESPDGQVLGPLSMIQILEGIAAGAILESARICEVGQQEWVNLSDVAYTREEETAPEPDVEPAVPEPEWATPTEAPEETIEPEAPVTETSLPGPAAEEPGEVEEEALPAHAESMSEGAGDFAIAMQFEDEEELVAQAQPKTRRRKPWLIPVVVGVALPIVVGIYLVAGGKLPLLNWGLERSSSKETAVSAPPAALESDTKTGATALDEGWKCLAAGDLQQATPAFKAALDENPNEARAYHGLGLIAMQRENPEHAIEQLEKAAELAPDAAEISLALAEAYLAAGDGPRAEVAARKALLRDPALSRAHLVTGRARMAQGNSAGALEELTAYLEAAPLDTAARHDLALTLAANGRMEPAVAEMNRYLEAYPDDREALLARLDWMLSAGDEAQAIVVHKALAEKYTESPLHQYLAGLAHGETEEGIHYLRRAIALDHRFADAHAALGRSLATVGHLEEAAQAFEKTAEIRPLTASERLRYSTVLTRLQPAATTAAAKQPPAQPQGKPFTEFLANVRSTLDHGDYDVARGMVYEGRTKFQGNRELTRNLDLWSAIVEYEAGNFEEALTILDGLDAGQSYAASGWGKGCVANWKARVHLAKGDYRAVIRSLDEVGTEDPNEYATAQLWEGVALSSLGMGDLAARTWSQIPADVPQDVGPAGRAARLTARFLAGNVSEKEYRTVAADFPAFENDMYFFLGQAALMAENTEVARTQLESAIASSHGHEFPYFTARFGIQKVLGTESGR